MGAACSKGATPAAAPVGDAPAAKTEAAAATNGHANGNGTSNGHSEAAAIIAKLHAAKKSNPDNLTAKNFDEAYYNSLSDELKPQFLKCVKSGAENADSGCGAYAMQPADYDRFEPFMGKIVADYHKVPQGTKHVNDWSLEGAEGLPEDGVLDLEKLGLPALSMRVRVGRNLADFPLPGAMTKDDRIAMEKKMCEAFKVLIDGEYGGAYYSLTPGHENFIDDAKYQELVKAHVMFKDMADDSYLASAGIASDWPFGRGCYQSEDKGFIIWVGEEDHLRIMCMKKGTVLNDVFNRLKTALDTVESIPGLKFAHSETFGYITSCPTNLGTGMRASLHIQVPNLTKDGTDTKAKEICKPLGLSVRGLGGEHTPIGADGTIDLSPSARFHIKESDIICALYKGIAQCVEAEKAAAA
jgi:creatine kinase